MLVRLLLPAVALLADLASAQVKADCNPMERTDCPPNPAFGTQHNWRFNATPDSDLWETKVGPITYDAENGAALTISKHKDSPTLRTKFFFFFGRTEVWIKAAQGVGIISSMMWLSEDLDEVDWEILGANGTHVASNYFGKGVEDWTNGGYHPADNIFDDFHNYTCTWTKEMLEWYIDGNKVRTLHAKDANNTEAYPQTPMRLSLGIWAGGDPDFPEATREWAGGNTDYDAGPYTMYVKSAAVEDYSTGKEYIWGDQTGSWESIEIVDGNSTAYKALNEEPEKTTAEKWEEMPSGAKIGIYSGAGAVGAAAVAALLFYCIKQRRRGAKENQAAEDRANAERMELERFKRDGIDPDGFVEHGQEYSARDMRKDGASTPTSYSVPATPSSPLGGNEKGWDNAAGAAAMAGMGGMRSPAPLLNNHSQSPPSPYRDQPSRGAGGFSPPPAMHAHRTPSPGLSRSQSPGMPPQGGLPPAPLNPNHMRMGSPGPMQQGRSFTETPQPYGANRMQTASPMSTRSFSQPQYGRLPQGNAGYGGGGYGHNGGY